MRCAVDIDPADYPLLNSVPDTHPPNNTLRMEWLPAPGAPAAPGADPWADDDPHGGWRPVP